MTGFTRIVHTAALPILLMAAAGAAQAQSADGFYKGKQLSIFVAGSAGGGIDLGARLLSRFIGKYLLGNPAVPVQDMPGAGGIRVLEYLATVAPRDGTQIGAFATGPLLDQMITTRQVSYKMIDFTAVGALEKDVSFCATWNRSPVKTLEDARNRVTTVGGTGAGSSTDIEPMVLNDVLGMKLKVISGYPGTQETILAMERGEVDGRCAFGWSSMNASKPDWLPKKMVNLLVQIGLEKHPRLPDVPLALDLAKTEADKQLMRVLATPLAMSRPYLAPPSLPAERTAELRKAFMAALADPEFRADFRKMTTEDPEPTDGATMQKLLVDMYSVPQSVQDRLRNIVNNTK
jgi:tripartite-type tricarboxylate transporter receptor subunit TctC